MFYQGTMDSQGLCVKITPFSNPTFIAIKFSRTFQTSYLICFLQVSGKTFMVRITMTILQMREQKVTNDNYLSCSLLICCQAGRSGEDAHYHLTGLIPYCWDHCCILSALQPLLQLVEAACTCSSPSFPHLLAGIVIPFL